jgi:diadenosine tetraphosphate (Ap4A) HIT family hydrolase
MEASKKSINFVMDKRLVDDCWLLGQWESSRLLLFDNVLVPWFILVPVTDVCEYYQLANDHQAMLQRQMNQLADFLKTQCRVDKVNIATLGNVVSQLHIHVVGRFHHDAYWPDVVWGKAQKEPYSKQDVITMAKQLQDVFGRHFSVAKFNHSI